MGALDDLIKETEARAAKQAKSATPALDALLAKVEQGAETTTKKKGVLGKVWESLSVPEKMSREGLKMLAENVPSVEPTGNAFRDVALNTPRIVAETVAEVAPSFVSRGSIATGGVLKGAKVAAPLIKGAGKAVAGSLEKLSGLSYKTPGVLSETVKDPTLFFAKGLESARKTYQGAKDLGGIRDTLKAPMSKLDFVKEALKAVDDKSITAEEALEARKSLDAIRKNLTDVGYRETRAIFDAIAKKKFAAADTMFQRAVKAENLREVFPMNKTGGPSIFKVGIGGATVPKLLLPAMSPAAQGATAATLGTVAKALKPFADEPGVGLAAYSILDQIFGRRE